LVRIDQAGADPEEKRLAAAAAPHDKQGFPPGEAKVQILENHPGVEKKRYISNFQSDFH
jgi:hypothetical protein